MDSAALDVLSPLRADPAHAVLLFDFDGTLAPIVERPEDAVPAPGTTDALAALARSYRRVGVLSGRPVSFLAAHLPEEVDLSGLYGLEARVGGRVVRHPDAQRWERAVEAVAAAAHQEAGPGAPLDGMVVESKVLSLTLHTRTRPDLEGSAAELARRLGQQSGLEVRAAKQSVELHPPVAVDKGTALLELAGDATTVLFAGDDVGDLPAFAALGHLPRSGAVGVAVIVGGPELPPALAALDGVHLEDQGRVLDLLRALRP